MGKEEEKKIAQINIEKLSTRLPKRILDRESNYLSLVKKGKNSPGKKLAALYSFMDEIYSFVSSVTPCKKGCSYCCHYLISIGEIEIAHIEKSTKNKRLKTYGPKIDFHGTPCPFLVNNGCSIYDARPFVCRRHVTMTSNSYWCDPVRSNEENFPLFSFTEIDSAFELIMNESGSIEFYDIRQVFRR